MKTSIQLLKGSDNGKRSYWSSSFTLIDLFIDVLFTKIQKYINTMDTLYETCIFGTNTLPFQYKCVKDFFFLSFQVRHPMRHNI